MRGKWAVRAFLVVLAGAAPVEAQLAEVQLGGVVSYGSQNAFRAGAGLAAGIGLARLAYAGARWVSHRDAQLYLVDFGLMIPVLGMEIVPGASLGAARLLQGDAHVTQFTVAPGVSAHAHILGLVLIPELNYHFLKQSSLPNSRGHIGVIASLRVAIPIEVRRIRY